MGLSLIKFGSHFQETPGEPSPAVAPTDCRRPPPFQVLDATVEPGDDVAVPPSTPGVSSVILLQAKAPLQNQQRAPRQVPEALGMNAGTTP